MILIGITGKAGAGKDTVGDVLKTGWGFDCVSFAGPIKAAISAMLDEPEEKWEDRAWKEMIHPLTGQSPRYMAQTLGTEWGRTHVSDNLWINLALAHIGRWHTAITDVRFENEAEVIRERGLLVHVHRDTVQPIDNITHSSEDGIVPRIIYPHDLHIQNTGSIQDLFNEVSGVMREVYRRKERLTA